jgi:hypothetical protein
VPPVPISATRRFICPGQHLRRLLLDHGALEEVRVELAPEAHGILEHEVAEVVVVEEPVLDQLVRSGTTSVMSGTSKWPMSELKNAFRRARIGFALLLKAHALIGSSARSRSRSA